MELQDFSSNLAAAAAATQSKQLSFLDLFSNWRKIALPYCAGFQNSFKKNKVDLLTLLDLRTYFKATKIKIYGIDVRQTKRSMGQVRESRNQMYTYIDNRFFTKVQRQFSGEKMMLNNWVSIGNQLNLDPCFAPHIKINSKCIIDLKIN